MNPNCPECKGTGKYVGLNVIEDCSICSQLPVTGGYSFDLSLDLPPSDASHFLRQTIMDVAAHFGSLNDRVQDYWEKFVDSSLAAAGQTLPTYATQEQRFKTFFEVCKDLPFYAPSTSKTLTFMTEVSTEGYVCITFDYH